jgi:hypothetical protein
MVFTWPMHPEDPTRPTPRAVPLTRRVVLRAAAAGGAVVVAGTGCDALRGGPQWHSPPDPLAGLRAATAALADRYDATIARHAQLADRLGPLRDDHRAHLDALDRQMLDTPSPTPSRTDQAVPDDPAAAVSALLAEEKSGVVAAADACLAAPSWRAALLGSIAAARASHVEVLT